MAALLTPAQLYALLTLEYEIWDLNRPNQMRYSEDVCRRLAEVLAPATGIDVQTAIDHARDNPWTMWVALITSLDNEATGYIFQNYDSWYDWEVVILQAFINEPPEKPGVPPEWIIRRLARIIDAEAPLFSYAYNRVFGRSVEEGLAEAPLFLMLYFIDYIDFFYDF